MHLCSRAEHCSPRLKFKGVLHIWFIIKKKKWIKSVSEQLRTLPPFDNSQLKTPQGELRVNVGLVKGRQVGAQLPIYWHWSIRVNFQVSVFVSWGQCREVAQLVKNEKFHGYVVTQQCITELYTVIFPQFFFPLKLSRQLMCPMWRVKFGDHCVVGRTVK